MVFKDGGQEPLAITSATRQVRQRWFSVCIFPLRQLFGLTGKQPAIPYCFYNQPLGGTHKKKETTQSFANWKKVQNGKNKEFAKSNSDN